MAFLVATPELGVDAILISLPLLGAKMTVLRVLAAVVVAMGIAVFVGRVADRMPVSSSDAGEAIDRSGSFFERLVRGLRYGFVEVVDHTGPWIILGIVVAALVGPLLEGDWLRQLPWGVDVVIFALLGMPTYVCASGATPLVAVLLMQGVSPGAALAFLLAGPATNVTTFGVLSRLHGRGIAASFAAGIAGMAVLIGLVVNQLFGDATALQVPDIHGAHLSWLRVSCLVVLALLYVLSILRQGPRGFMAQVHSPFQSGGDECADACHPHGHSHAHSH
jgi:uncharacterized membrane protein YraQ (UPF0718 family)